MMSASHRSRSEHPVMVIHGPEIFDCGDAAWLLDLLAPSRTIVAGVMARTAAEESGLPVEFDGRPPSAVIRDAEGPVFLANRGKTPHSGRIFGDMVASRLGSGGLVHVECSAERVWCWNTGNRSLAGYIAARTGFGAEEASSTAQYQEHSRLIRGCIPGEPVYVNGIIIGYATADVVVLRDGRECIEVESGLIPKPHGLEKLRSIRDMNIGSAWCKSGAVRIAKPLSGCRVLRNGRVAVIDHCGHEIYARIGADCCGILAVGDDTTAVCGHICSHRGIPVLGITDTDADDILPASFAPGSVILDVRPSRDDDLGREVAHMVPEGPICWDDWVREVLAHLADRVSITLDMRDVSP